MYPPNRRRRKKNERVQEIVTAYDDHLNPIGEYPRSYVHRNRLWHDVCQCWLVEVRYGKVRLYFQRRSYEKRSHPGKYDITSGGHVMAGEKIRQAMVRELREETGIIMKPEDLIEIARFREASGNDKEVANIYFSIQGDPPFRCGNEVSYMVSADIHEYKEMCEGKRESIEVVPAVRTGPLIHETFTAKKDDFTDHASFLAVVYPFIMEYVEKYIAQYK